MLIISIDGACHRNGKEDCVAAAGVFVRCMCDDNLTLKYTKCLANYEVGSTNQRGEMLALLTALDYALMVGENANIITDSEYLFNTITKGWYRSWMNNKWLTSMGKPVKNKDLWESIIAALENCESADLEISLFHIKGHCIPFGKVRAKELMQLDSTGLKLMLEVELKYDQTIAASADILPIACELSLKNNGFVLQPDTLKSFVVNNLMADIIATHCVEAADALM